MINRKKRLADGSFGPVENITGAETPEEKVKRIEAESLAAMIALTEKHEENLQLIAMNEQLQQMTLVALQGVAEINEKMLAFENKVATPAD